MPPDTDARRDLYGHWVRLTYRVADGGDIRTISGRVHPPPAPAIEGLAFLLQITGTSQIPVYENMIVECEVDPEREWLSRAHSQDASGTPWWV